MNVIYFEVILKTIVTAYRLVLCYQRKEFHFFHLIQSPPNKKESTIDRHSDDNIVSYGVFVISIRNTFKFNMPQSENRAPKNMVICVIGRFERLNRMITGDGEKSNKKWI